MAGLFDIFSNTNAQDAANAQIAGLNSGYGMATSAINQGSADLTNYFGNANNALTGNYANALQSLMSGTGQAAGALQSGTGQAAGALSGNYMAALQPFLQNYGQAQQGTNALGNVLGLNGQAGNNSAMAALQNSPGYQFTLDQGSQNVMRNAAQTGTLNSGATLNALQQQGQGAAQQNYNSYVSQLQPYLSASNAAAGGINSTMTGLGSGLAGLYSGMGTGLSSLYSGAGSNAANIQTSLGGTQAGVDMTLGQSLNQNQNTLASAGWNLGTGTGNAQANADLANNSASANMWNAILGGGKLLASGAGAVMSDARVKDDIEPVGELYDGTNVYRFRYKGDPVTHVGLIAQDVEKKNPDAVIDIGGIKAVRYDKATQYASKLAEFLEAA